MNTTTPILFLGGPADGQWNTVPETFYAVREICGEFDKYVAQESCPIDTCTRPSKPRIIYYRRFRVLHDLEVMLPEKQEFGFRRDKLDWVMERLLVGYRRLSI